MKIKLILLLYLSLLGVGLNAQQQYKSVLNNGMARWSILAGGVYFFDSYDIIVNNNDTLINDLLYRKIYEIHSTNGFKNDIEWQSYIPDVEYMLPNRNYFIRESEDASKLYLFYTSYNGDKTAEYLISDLDLEVGDGYILPTYFGGIVYVKDVYVKDGLKHVQLNYSGYGPEGDLTFIEGVGSNMLSYHVQMGFAGPRMINCFQNDIHFYKSEFAPEYYCHCGWREPHNNLVKIDYEDFNIQIENRNLIISCETLQNVQVVIDNIQGQRCFNKSFSGLQNLSIPIVNFSKGVYVLRVFDKNTNKQYTSKIIL